MKTFYTVDVGGRLRPGQVLRLQPVAWVATSAIWSREAADTQPPTGTVDAARADAMAAQFGAGVTPHGIKIINRRYPEDERKRLAEKVFDDVRRMVAPDAPSRLQSLFAFDSIDAARAWHRMRLRDSPRAALVSVEGTNARRYDMALLGVNGDSYEEDALRDRARRYWKGETSRQPCWEWLVPLPVRVLDVLPE